MDWGGKYRPTPTDLPVLEMRGMIELTSIIVNQMAQMEGLECISLGYNSSPLNFGLEEEKGGLQSVVTQHHFQVWNWSKENSPTARFEDLPENMKSFLDGDRSTEWGVRVMEHIVGQIDSNLIGTKDITNDGQALRIELDQNLSELLKKPMQFAEYIQKLHGQIEWANINLWEAITTESYRGYQGYLKSVYEDPSITPNMNWIRMSAELRSLEEREENIRNLPPELFPPDVIRRLLLLNPFMKDRSEAAPDELIRHGLGHVWVVTQDLRENNAVMFLRPATKIVNSKGGVVEAQGISLKRQVTAEGVSEDIIQQNIDNTDRLVECLPNSISYKSVRQTSGIRR
jgi:hypothetical protein